MYWIINKDLIFCQTDISYTFFRKFSIFLCNFLFAQSLSFYAIFLLHSPNFSLAMPQFSFCRAPYKFDHWELWFNPFDFKSLRLLMMKKRICRFYLLADFMSWILIQLLIEDSDEIEKMQILSASWFYVLETYTTDDWGLWFSSFDFKSLRLLKMKRTLI